jgi:hypothetical protein
MTSVLIREKAQIHRRKRLCEDEEGPGPPESGEKGSLCQAAKFAVICYTAEGISFLRLF